MRESTRYRGVYVRRDTRNRPRYQIDYVGSDKKRRFKTLPLGTTAKEAHEHRSKLITRMAGGERIAPTRITVDELWERWFESHQDGYSHNTCRNWESAFRLHVHPLIGAKKVSNLTADDLAWLIREMKQKGLMTNSINSVLTPLKLLLTHAVRRGMIGSNPFSLLERSERPRADATPTRILTPDEMDRLLGASTEPYRSILTVALFTGMRVSEILGLRWEDVDFEKGELHVRKSKTDAGRRTVVMVEPVSRILAKNSLECGVQGSAGSHVQVFSCATRTVNRYHHQAVTAAGIPYLKFHELRHTFASILIHLGYDEAFITDQMGHSSISITHKVYGHLFDAEAKKIKMREDFARQFGGVT